MGLSTNAKQQVITFTLFRFEGRQAFWIFGQMQKSIKDYKAVQGLEFFKLMGSGGKNGFSKMLNVNVYALLAVWESEQSASSYFEESAHFSGFQKRATEFWNIFMNTSKAHGKWSGKNPFETIQPYESGPIAVITRARIKFRFLRKFWSYVPAVSKNMDDRDGSIFSVGIGEYPWLMQATFSLWEDEESMRNYAYRSKFHREVIQKTRALGWYSEELFANFVPYKTVGSWEGANPLRPLMNPAPNLM
ncbi:spheroidene monooxygenase [Aquiflexum sp. LQ15W]|uniref:spheroidene monooxygenase n=1 Tax=Cognataquiflexum nitidum TaxID=2922272 RepID=UPI001F144BEE|nr:spheroidene monooxygenase [Cognataquiflexum nitidum]MCH6199517.1 spheroidene monooxygenase [Cognataquiflexum nitidum]